MIGQKNLLQILENYLISDDFPHFCLIVGPEGSGKKTLVDHIYNTLFDNAVLLKFGISVAEVRHAITQSYSISGTKAIMLFADADKMSTESKNALLKVTEEPPNDVYYIMTVQDLGNVLDTIKSRATIFNMECYTAEEIDEYYKLKTGDNSATEERTIIMDICETPGEVDSLLSYDVLPFYDYVTLVVDNISEVSSANSFKIADKLAFKADSEGYDVRMFLKFFMSICIKKMNDDPLKYSTGVSITSRYLRELGIRGVNKQMLIDSWILEIRQFW